MRWLLLVLVAVGLLVPPAAEGATLTATPSTLTSVLTGAQGGDTILLAAGSYSLSTNTVKASRVTITPAAGVARSAVKFTSLTLGTAQNLRISGVTLAGFTISTPTAVARHILLDANNVTAGACIHTGVDNAQADIVIDGNTFGQINAGGCGADGRLSVVGDNRDHAGVSGVVITNNVFGPGGCTDGVYLANGDRGTVVGPGNEFVGIVQGNCTAHVDSVQFYGGRDETLTGNWFHDGTDALMSSNGNGDGARITGNVFGPSSDGYPFATVDCGGDDMLYDHNVYVGAKTLYLCAANAGEAGPTTQTTVRNNVLSAGFSWAAEAPFTGTTTASNLTAATFAGGSGRCQYALAAGSAGKGKATDGTDIGLNDCESLPPLPPHPPLPVDTDRDGIPDSQDACPTVVGALPDGCPPPVPPPTCADVPECVTTKAQVAQLQSDLAAMTASRDDTRALLDAALAKIAVAVQALR